MRLKCAISMVQFTSRKVQRMPLYGAACLLVSLLAVLTQTGLAQCSASTKLTQEQRELEDRSVLLAVKLSRRGAVRDAAVIRGREGLRAPAIRAVKARKYKHRIVYSRPDAREMMIEVIFPQDGSGVPDIRQALPAGVSSCIPAGPIRVPTPPWLDTSLSVQPIIPLPSPIPVEVRSEINVGETIYKIKDRIALDEAMVFREPYTSMTSLCLNKEKNCRIPAGRIAGLIPCESGSAASARESLTQTFGRVPGKDSPSLLVSILGVHLSSATDGELDIAVLACGPRVAIPVQQGAMLANGSSFDFNRLTVSVSGRNSVAGFTLFGIEAQPETYRVVGMHEGIVFVVRFKNLDGLDIEREDDANEGQTQGLHFLEGDFVSGSYSAIHRRYEQHVTRDIFPVPQTPVPVSW